MLILICTLINISGNNPPIGIKESRNDSKRTLEEQIDNYIILQFGQDVSYENKKFLFNVHIEYEEDIIDYNQYISYIMNGDKKLDPNAQFTVKSNTKLEVHFNQIITSLEKFFDIEYDENFHYLILLISHHQ